MAMKRKSSVVKRKSAPKHKKNAIKAHCLSCRKGCFIDTNGVTMKRNLPNGRVVYILCGKCNDCDGKVCRIMSNQAA